MATGRTNATNIIPDPYYLSDFKIWINNMNCDIDIMCSCMNARQTMDQGVWGVLSNIQLEHINSCVSMVFPLLSKFKIVVWSEKDGTDIEPPCTIVETSDSRILSVALSKDYLAYDDLDGWGITFTPVRIREL